MKKIYAPLFFLICFLAHHSSVAQFYEVSLADKITHATTVFEGKVLDKKCFSDPSDGMIYTAYLVKAYTLFKGDVPGDTIELVAQGGQIGHRGVIVSHGTAFGRGEKGLFFCIDNTWPSLFGSPTVASFQVYAGPQGFIRYRNKPHEPPARDMFHIYQNIEEQLFQPLEDFTGMERKKLSLTDLEMQFQHWLECKNIRVESGGREFGIIYSFGFPQITPTTITFDVVATVSSGTYAFGNAEVVIEYDTSMFFQNIAGAGAITVTKGDIISSSDYTIGVSDETPEKVKIEISAASTPINLGVVDGIPDDVCQVEIDISGLTQPIDILFDESLMDGQTDYYHVQTSSFYSFPFVVASDSLHGIAGSAAVKIDSISFVSPSNIAGYDNGLILIAGSEFGFIQGTVHFTSADPGPMVEAIGDDYVGWLDNLIAVKIPSMDTTAFRAAGTGPIMVTTASGATAISPDTLDIPCALTTRRMNPQFDYRAITLRHSDFNGNGGITLTLNDTFDTGIRAGARAEFLDALDKWRCITEINIDVNSATSSVNGVDIFDSTHIVTFGTLPAGKNAGTFIDYEFCETTLGSTTGNDLHYYISSVDIIFNKDVDWFISSGLNIGATQTDFHSVALHEIGHAHLLEHALTSNKVMYYFHGQGSSGIRRTLHAGDLLGGNLIADSSLSSYNCVSGQQSFLPAMIPYQCSANAIEEHDFSQGITWYYEPHIPEVIVVLDDPIKHKNPIGALYDISGRLLYQQNLEVGPRGIIRMEVPDQISRGTYIFQIKTSSSLSVKRFPIMK